MEKQPAPSVPASHGLVTLLSGGSEAWRRALATRLRFTVDPAMRIDPVQQLARALLGQAWARDPALLPTGQCDWVRKLLLAGGCLPLAESELEAAVTELLDRGIAFRRDLPSGPCLLLPLAYLAQMATWEGEDARGFRAGLVQLEEQDRCNIASFHLERSAVRPYALALETAVARFLDPKRLAEFLAQLPNSELQLLRTIEAMGSEVDGEELATLEQEPLRLRNAGPVQHRGTSVLLQRSGCLLHLAPSRFRLPLEVALWVGRGRRDVQERRRVAVAAWTAGDHTPLRAEPAPNVASLLLALSLKARSASLTTASAWSSRGGIPKTWQRQAALQLGIREEHAALLSAHARALGMLEPELPTVIANARVDDLPNLVFTAWRSGSAWDESRVEPERSRAKGLPSPPVAASLRDLCIAALSELGEGRWVPLSGVLEYALSDTRVVGLNRLLTRSQEREAGVFVELPVALERILCRSLPSLGAVELGISQQHEQAAPRLSSAVKDLGSHVDADPEGELVLRVTRRGLSWFRGDSVDRSSAKSEAVNPLGQPSRLNGNELRVGAEASVATVLRLWPVVEVVATQPALLLRVPTSVQLVSEPRELQNARERLLASQAALQQFGELSPPLEAWFSEYLGAQTTLSFERVAAFIRVSGELRAQLLAHEATALLFLANSPNEGLLVRHGISLPMLEKACRQAGIVLAQNRHVSVKDAEWEAEGVTPRRGVRRTRRKETGSIG